MSPRTRQAADLPPLRPLTVAGVMSGTSADGIDVAIVRIGPRRPRGSGASDAFGTSGTLLPLSLKLLHHQATPFPRSLRQAILAAAGSGETTTAALARLHWRLGLAYAERVKAAVDASSLRIDLVGCHGQTIYHQGAPQPFLGRSFACTWQIGEPALLARVLGVPVIANFRPADMAQGGQGAPLVPLLDYVLYRHRTRARVLQNIGGIGNLSVVPADAGLEHVLALDTGPGNMIIDALMQQLYGRAFDRDGGVARSGTALLPVVEQALRAPFFRKAPPKSAGREQFGAPFATALLAHCRLISSRPEDAIATATALTAASIALAVRQYVLATVTHQEIDFFVAGGGAKNATLLSLLREQLAPLGCKVATTAGTALPVDAKEAAAFALLAYQTWHRRPGNVPSATGAGRPAILGQICYA